MSTENIEQSTAVNEAEREARFAASGGCAALIQWLKTEQLEDEGAMVYARDQGEWDRYHRLDGHKGALVHVLHHIRAMQHNDQLTDAGRAASKLT